MVIDSHSHMTRVAQLGTAGSTVYFFRRFGTASMVSTGFSAYTIGFLLRVRLSWKSLRYYVSVQTQGRVYAASEWQCISAGGEVQVPGVVFAGDRRWCEEIDTWIGKANA